MLQPNDDFASGIAISLIVILDEAQFSEEFQFSCPPDPFGKLRVGFSALPQDDAMYCTSASLTTLSRRNRLRFLFIA